MTDDWITIREAAQIVGLSRVQFWTRYLPHMTIRPYPESKYRRAHPEVKRAHVWVLRSEAVEIANSRRK